ncbi:Proteasome inhibitor-related protein [Spatholobus suberectus]|nr:Proteasome inhibitor-related protein [Spatholobus suberectus]
MKKPHVLVLLIIMVVSIAEKPSVIEGRTLSLISGQGYSKIFATLGVVCKCCDGVGGACTSYRVISDLAFSQITKH